MFDVTQIEASELASDWLQRFEARLVQTNPEDLASLFTADCYWRDAVALTWTLKTVHGSAEVSGSILAANQSIGLVGLALDSDSPLPQIVERVGRSCLEAYFRFETKTGRGRGIVRLIEDANGDLRAWTLLTALEELKGHEEKIGSNRPIGQSFSRDFNGPNWLDDRIADQAYEDREPMVLIVGSGQAGLSTAARLRQLGVDTLIVDPHERVGDTWRKRYHALTLHNQIYVNHLPYLDFPKTWPVYIPKDKLANWFETYAEALELNIWTGHALSQAAFDDETQIWTATLTRADGSTRVVRPRHIVMATGVSGIPNIPDLPGLSNFNGTVLHSSQYQDGEDWNGKKAVVIGSGNSGHDVAQDLTSSGASVTLVQRSPTHVINIEPSAQLPYTAYDGSRSLEDTDLIAVSMPIPLMREQHVANTAKARVYDAELLAGLEAVGFKLDPHEGHPGWQFKYLTRGGGYYFNVGCSDMLINGEIGLMQYSEIESFTDTGLQRSDGTDLEADLIVLATGYRPKEELVGKLFGEAVQTRLGPIWGFGDQLEIRNMYCQTNQPGLWFIEGSFAQCRINSKFLALQIKAFEEGLIPRREGI
ncbi:MAG: NAD(P)/FAD-dependent oxidoreductase [Pseudomonadota bacterium]